MTAARLGYAAELTVAGTAYVLTVRDGDLTLDEAWSPYGQVRLTTPIPDADLLTLINPQASQIRLTVWHSHQPNDATGDPLERPFSFLLRSRSVDHAAGTMTLVGATDEILLHDYARVASTTYAPGTTSVRAVVSYALTQIGATLQPGTADAVIPADASEWLPGVSAWSYLEPLVQAADLRLWCDEHRRWHLERANSMSAGYVQLSYLDTITAATDIISRDENWYDAVVIVYEWLNTSGVPQRTVDSATASGFSKVLTLTYQTKPPGTGAAAKVLKRRRARGRVLDLAAVSHPSVSPTAMVQILMPPGTPTQTGVVSAVTWNYGTDEMQITTRELIDTPTTAWVNAPAGRRWQDITAGTTWTTYTA